MMGGKETNGRKEGKGPNAFGTRLLRVSDLCGVVPSCKCFALNATMHVASRCHAMSKSIVTISVETNESEIRVFPRNIVLNLRYWLFALTTFVRSGHDTMCIFASGLNGYGNFYIRVRLSTSSATRDTIRRKERTWSSHCCM